MQKTHLPNVIDADLYMRMKYETAFGIFNHELPDDKAIPWPLMAVSLRESYDLMDPLDFRLDQYAENKVGDIFHISFDELIKYPRRDFKKIIESAKKHSAKLAASGDALFKQLNTAMNVQKQKDERK